MLHKGMYMACAMFAAFAMAACSDDDENTGGGNGGEGNGGTDGSKFETPKYEAEAAKFTIDDSNSPFSYVELTAAGNYIIYTNESLAPSATTAEQGERKSIMAKAKLVPDTRYIHFSNILTGSYTKTSDNTYALDGFGTLTVSQEEGSSYSLDMARNGGETYSLSGNRAGTPTEGEMTSNLCRTWKITQWRAYLRYDHETMYDFSAPTVDELNAKIREWGQEVDPDYTDDDYLIEFNNGNAPQELIFTKSGTYMVTYADSKLAVSTWRWANQTKGLLEYSWNPFSFDPEELYGRATITFRNNKLEINEGYSDEEDGYLFEQGTTYTLEEVK